MQEGIKVVVTFEDYQKALEASSGKPHTFGDPAYVDGSSCPGAQMVKRVLNEKYISYVHGYADVFSDAEHTRRIGRYKHTPSFCYEQFKKLRYGQEHEGILTKIG